MAKPKKLTLDDLRSVKAGENSDAAEMAKKKVFWKSEGRGKSSCIEGRSIVGPGGPSGAATNEKCVDDGKDGK